MSMDSCFKDVMQVLEATAVREMNISCQYVALGKSFNMINKLKAQIYPVC